MTDHAETQISRRRRPQRRMKKSSVRWVSEIRVLRRGDERLHVHRHVGDLVLHDLRHLVDHALTLRVVELGLDHRQELVDARVREPAESSSLPSFFSSSGVATRKRIGCSAFERAGRPAEEVHVEPSLAELRPVVPHRHRVEVGAEPDAGEHRGRRLADRLVVQVAIVRAAEPEREAVGEARVGEQRPGRLRVVREARRVRRRVAAHLVGDELGGGLGGPAHDLGGERVDVDRLVGGLPDARVEEGVRVPPRRRRTRGSRPREREAEQDDARPRRPSCTVNPLRSFMRGTSCSGIGEMKSISPERSAATPVALSPIGVNTPSVTLPMSSSHQPSNASSTVRTPGSRARRRGRRRCRWRSGSRSSPPPSTGAPPRSPPSSRGP